MNEDFYSAVLDSLTDHIAVVDAEGVIQWVNDAWRRFAEDNGGEPGREWIGTNYLEICGAAAATGEAQGTAAIDGLEAVIRGDVPLFYMEYPCHSPTESRWFMMRVCPLRQPGTTGFLVTHQNITERKLAELRVEELAALDGLTGLANRRRFDAFLDDEWNRALRLGHPVSAVLLDVDRFKQFNDSYGHLEGDTCLRRVAEALTPFSRRPGDLVARYGGEEFAAVFGNTEAAAAAQLAEQIRRAVEALGIEHAHAVGGVVTVSAGVATAWPQSAEASQEALLGAADRALYVAKASGRNRVHVASEDTAEA